MPVSDFRLTSHGCLRRRTGDPVDRFNGAGIGKKIVVRADDDAVMRHIQTADIGGLADCYAETAPLSDRILKQL